MSDAYEILGLPRGASDADVRHRYLELVRQNPPDRVPERFTEIRQAYEKLRDPVVRMRSTLFDLESSQTLTDVVADLRRRVRSARIPTPTLLSLAEGP